MKALTVRQPWAWAIINGGKTIENRSRRTYHRGPLLIHAAVAYDSKALTGPHGRHLIDAQCPPGSPLAYALDLASKPVGVLLGTVDVVGCHPAHSWTEPAGTCSRWAQPDMWHWELANPRPFAEPIPCKGRLGLWSPPADVLAQIATLPDYVHAADCDEQGPCVEDCNHFPPCGDDPDAATDLRRDREMGA